MEIEARRAAQRAASSRFRQRHPERVAASMRAYHAANRDAILERQRAYNTLRHGITPLIRTWMYESQDGGCAGCGSPTPDSRLEIDHDHSCCPGQYSCGRCVRGLVCHPCNIRDAMTAIFDGRTR